MDSDMASVTVGFHMGLMSPNALLPPLGVYVGLKMLLTAAIDVISSLSVHQWTMS